MDSRTRESHHAGSLRELRGSLKWLVATAGATAAALVAGLQIGHLGDLPIWIAAIGACAALLALAIAFEFLHAAALVLTIPEPTIIDLRNKEANDPHALYPARTEPPADPLVAWIYQRRTLLLGGATSIGELYTQAFDLAKDLSAPEASQAPRDLPYIRQRLEDVQARITTIEEATHLHLTEVRYDQLMTNLRKRAGLFAAGVLVFALAPALQQKSAAVQVTQPIPVTIFVQDPHEAGIPLACGSQVAGVAVGGDLKHPVVALPATKDCPARLLDSPPGVVVVPAQP